MAQGTVFWQGIGDAVEVDAFTSAGVNPPPNRSRDVGFQWVNLWGSNHQREITGPRTDPTGRASGCSIGSSWAASSRPTWSLTPTIIRAACNSTWAPISPARGSTAEPRRGVRRR